MTDAEKLAIALATLRDIAEGRGPASVAPLQALNALHAIEHDPLEDTARLDPPDTDWIWLDAP